MNFVRKTVSGLHTDDSNPKFQSTDKKGVHHETYKGFREKRPTSFTKEITSFKKESLHFFYQSIHFVIWNLRKQMVRWENMIFRNEHVNLHQKLFLICLQSFQENVSFEIVFQLKIPFDSHTCQKSLIIRWMKNFRKSEIYSFITLYSEGHALFGCKTNMFFFSKNKINTLHKMNEMNLMLKLHGTIMQFFWKQQS